MTNLRSEFEKTFWKEWTGKKKDGFDEALWAAKWMAERLCQLGEDYVYVNEILQLIKEME